MAFVVLKKKSSQTTSLKSLERKALMGEDPNKRSLESSSFQQNGWFFQVKGGYLLFLAVQNPWKSFSLQPEQKTHVEYF